jgi:hypothetical protein
MAEIKRNFLGGKMEKDLDPKLIKNGLYTEGQNITISESEDNSVGTVQNILGNKLAYSTELSLGAGVEIIGYCLDQANNRVFWFVTNFDAEDSGNIRTMPRASSGNCKIIYKDLISNNEPITIVSGDFLNFNKKKPIVNTNIIDDLLFWTDDYNQPRKINVQRAIENPTYYNSEDLISLAKVAPYKAPMLIEHINASEVTNSSTLPANNANVDSDYLEENFVRFSYRYIYEDNEESIMAPFTQTVFRPLNSGNISTTATDIESEENIVKEGVVNIMKNDLNDITLRIPLHGSDNLYENIIWTTNFGAISASTPGDTFSIDFGAGVISTPDETYIVKGVDSTTSTSDITHVTIPALGPGSTTCTLVKGSLTTGGSDDIALVPMWRNSAGLKKIQILIKESDDTAVRILSEINVSGRYLNERKTSFEDKIDVYPVRPEPAGNIYWRYCYAYNYKSEKPYKTLPEADIIRVNDQIPVRSKTQELVSNRIVFGNFTENYDLPFDESGNKGVNFVINTQAKGDSELNAAIPSDYGLLQHNEYSYQYNSIKQNRTYQVGVVLMDKYGRESSVILSTNANLNSYTEETDTFTVPAVATDFSSYFDELAGDITTNQTSFGAGTYFSPSFTTSGSGISGAFTVVVGSSGSVTSVEVTSAGSGYLAGDTITITNAALGGSTVGEDLVITLSDNGLKGHSWTEEQRNVFGKSLNIDFRDSRIVPTLDAYSTSNPNGWYAWKLVVKQQEQEYYNVYVNHAADGGTTREDSSWIVLKNDNINKVPRAINDIDVNREGITGSNVRLFPKVTHGSSGTSVQAPINSDELYIDVIAVGTAADFGLNRTSLDNSSPLIVETPGWSGSQWEYYPNKIYGWINNGNSNPLLAELPCLEVDYANDNSIDLTTVQSNDGPFEGLSVFETKPFESKLDIYYETSTSGLVSDLNSLMSVVSTGPTDIEWSVGGDTISFAEVTTVGTTVGTIQATAVAPATSISEFEIIEIKNGNDVNVGSRLSVNSLTGVVKVDGGGFHFDNSQVDNHKIFLKAIDNLGGYTYAELYFNITNSAPTVTFDAASYDVTSTSSANVLIASGTYENGAVRSDKKYDDVSLSVQFPNATGGNIYNYPSMFYIITNTGGTFDVYTSQSIQNYIVSFGNESALVRTMQITAKDLSGTTGYLSDTDTAVINVQAGRVEIRTVVAPSAQGIINIRDAATSDNAVTTIWAAKGTSTNPPTNTYLFPGHILYSSEFGSEVVGDGYYAFEQIEPTGYWDFAHWARIGAETDGVVNNFGAPSDGIIDAIGDL